MDFFKFWSVKWSAKSNDSYISIAIHDTPTCQVKQPSAHVFYAAQVLFIADEHSNNIFMMNIETHGFTASATILSQLKCPKQTFGIAVLDIIKYIYISSSDPVSGGILCFEYDGDEKIFCLSSASSSQILKNGSPECNKPYSLAFLPSTPAPRTLFSLVEQADGALSIVSLYGYNTENYTMQ